VAAGRLGESHQAVVWVAWVDSSGSGGQSVEGSWQQRALISVGLAVLLAYLVIVIIEDNAPILPIAAASVGAFTVAMVLKVRRGKEDARKGRPRLLGVFLGLGIVGAYLAGTAFQDLPAWVRGMAISVVLGASLGVGSADLLTKRMREKREGLPG